MDTLLLILVVFVTSPVSLELPRMPTAFVVIILVGLSLVFQGGTRKKTTLDRLALAFVAFSAANGFVSGLFGNSWREVLNELMPIVEAYFGFILVSRCEWDEAKSSRALRIVLITVCTRAAWQLILTLSGHYVIPPIYPPDDRLHALVWIGNFSYVRLIDPVCGMFFPLSLILYFHGIHRRLSAWTATLSGIVSVLGLTRSEWIATAVVLCLTFWFGKLKVAKRKLLLTAAGVVVAVGLVLAVSPGFLEYAQRYFVGLTITQVTDQGDQYSELRLLEVFTALDEFRSAPLLGHGLGSEIGTVVSRGSETDFITLHNYYLNWVATTGLLGLALFGWLVYRILRFSGALLRTSKTDLSIALSLCAMGSLVWWGVFMAFNAIYSAYHATVIIGAVYGMAVDLAVSDRLRASGISLSQFLAATGLRDGLTPRAAWPPQRIEEQT